MKQQAIKFLRITSFIFGLAWIWVFFYNWKLAIALIFIIWANNIALYLKSPEGKE